MSEGTNGLPRELEEALVKAKEWYDRQDLDAMTQDEVDISASKGADILSEIVEAVEETWGWGRSLKKASD